MVDHLYLLIQSLTPAEKGYFHRWARVHSKEAKPIYLELFEHYSKADAWQEVDDKKLSFGEQHLANHRRNLQKNLLRSLQNFHGGLSPEAQAREELNRVEILYLKENFKICDRQLRSAIKRAQRSECWLELVQLLNLRVRLLRKLEIPGAREYEEIRESYQLKKEAFAKYHNLEEYRELFDEIFASVRSVQVIGWEELLRKVKEWSQLPLLHSEEKALCREAKIYFHNIHAYLCLMQNQRGEGLDHFRRNVELWQQSKLYLKGRELNFMVALAGLMDRLLNQELYTEFIDLLAYLKKLPTSSTFVRITRDFFVSFESLKYLVSVSDRNTFRKEIPHFERFILDKGALFQNSQKIPYLFNLFSGFFHLENWSKALEWLYYIERETRDSDKRPDIHASLDVLQLLCQFNLGSEVLQSRLQSVDHRLRQQRKMGRSRLPQYRFDHLIYRIVKALSKAVLSSEKRRSILADFQQETQAFKEEGGTKPIGFTEFGAWFDASLAGKELWEFKGKWK